MLNKQSRYLCVLCRVYSLFSLPVTRITLYLTLDLPKASTPNTVWSFSFFALVLAFVVRY